MITDVIKEDLLYYPLRSDMKPDYELNIDDQKRQSNDSKIYTLEERSKSTASKFNKLIINEEKSRIKE